MATPSKVKESRVQVAAYVKPDMKKRMLAIYERAPRYNFSAQIEYGLTQALEHFERLVGIKKKGRVV